MRLTFAALVGLLVAPAALSLSGCRSAQPLRVESKAEGPEEAAVRAARASQNRAIVAGDVDRVAEFWTDDVAIRRGLGAAVIGKAAYRQLFVTTGSDSNVVYQRSPTRVEASATWPLAYESGTWVGRLGADGPVVIRGEYAAQWVKRAGRWLIRSEVFVALTCAGIGCSYSATP